MIECCLQPFDAPGAQEIKNSIHGIYTGSWLPLKDYGRSIWGVCVGIDLDYDKVKKEYDDDDEILENCIKFLNLAPKSKYGRTRKRKPLYKFESKPYEYKVLAKKNKTYISAVLHIKENNNKYFYGKGDSY